MWCIAEDQDGLRLLGGFVPWVVTHGFDPATATQFYMVCYVTVGSANAHPRLGYNHRSAVISGGYAIIMNYEL